MKKAANDGTAEALKRWLTRNEGRDHQTYTCPECKDRGIIPTEGTYANHRAFQDPATIARAAKVGAMYARPCGRCELGRRIRQRQHESSG